MNNRIIILISSILLIIVSIYLYKREGDKGPQGPQGDKGPQGDIGPVGLRGPQGPQGDKGIQGDRGPIGLQGDRGPVGLQGPQGIQGQVGPQGPQGPQGIVGVSKLPSNDTRDSNETPSYWRGQGMGTYNSFKKGSVIGLKGIFWHVTTYVPWGDNTAGDASRVIQEAHNGFFTFKRIGNDNDTWSEWLDVSSMDYNPSICNNSGRIIDNVCVCKSSTGFVGDNCQYIKSKNNETSVKGNYVRISSPMGLNIRWIKVFGPSGNLLTPTDTWYSSQYSSNSVDNKIIKDYDNTKTNIAHTTLNDTPNNPKEQWLEVNFNNIQDISRIEIKNRIVSGTDAGTIISRIGDSYVSVGIRNGSEIDPGKIGIITYKSMSITPGYQAKDNTYYNEYYVFNVNNVSPRGTNDPNVTPAATTVNTTTPVTTKINSGGVCSKDSDCVSNLCNSTNFTIANTKPYTCY